MTLEEDMRMRERRSLKKQKKEIALNMLKGGIKPDIISKVTGLTIEEIEEL